MSSPSPPGRVRPYAGLVSSREPSTTPSGQTRDETQAATRQAILRSAEAQFLAKGYRGANLGEIAKDAGYSKGAIYSNFTSKHALFLEVGDARGERKSRPLLDALEHSDDMTSKLGAFADWLRSISTADSEWVLVETEFTLIERRSPEVAATLRERYRDAKAAVAEVISEQLSALNITPRVEVSIIAETLMALQSGLALSHAVEPSVGSEQLLEVFGALVGDATLGG